MTFEIAFVFAVIALALALFISGRLPIDQVAMGVPVVLLLGGVVSPRDAVAGLSSEATVTVAAMLVLGLGLVKTGAIAEMSRWARGVVPGRPMLRLFLLCLLVAAISPFLNNTAVVVVFLPVFVGLAHHAGDPASKYLMPLSFVAILGGTVTMLGTSTNLIVYGMARSRGLEELHTFSIAPLGLAYLAVGMTYLFTVGRVLLPARAGPPDLSGKYEVRRFTTELRVAGDSPIAGKTLEDLRWRERHGVSIVGIERGDRSISAPGGARFVEGGDLLYVQGSPNQLLTLATKYKLRTPAEEARQPRSPGIAEGRLVEVLVAPASDLAGHTLRELGFQQRFGSIVLAIQRHGEAFHGVLADIPVQVGDLLLVHGRADRLAALADEPGLVPLAEVARPAPARPRALVAVAIMAGVIAAAGFGIAEILQVALVGVALMVFSRCVSLEEAYRELDWSVVVLLAGLIPLGLAMDRTGAAHWLAVDIAELLAPLGPTVAVGCFYVLTSLLTETMSNNAAAVVLTPVAIAVAGELGLNPYALLVAVMFGASASFMTPVGYQTNALVYGPGGYRFADFLRVGGPLNLILAVVAALLIPRFWPS